MKKVLLSLKFFHLRVVGSLVVLPFGVLYGIIEAFVTAWRMSLKQDLTDMFLSIRPYIKDVFTREFWDEMDEARKTDSR